MNLRQLSISIQNSDWQQSVTKILEISLVQFFQFKPGRLIKDKSMKSSLNHLNNQH